MSSLGQDSSPPPTLVSPFFLGTAYSTFIPFSGEASRNPVLKIHRHTFFFFLSLSPHLHPCSCGLVTTLIARGGGVLPSIIFLNASPLVLESLYQMAAAFPTPKTLPSPPPPHILGLSVAYAPVSLRYPCWICRVPDWNWAKFCHFSCLGCGDRSFKRMTLKTREKMCPLWILFLYVCKPRCEVNGGGQ